MLMVAISARYRARCDIILVEQDLTFHVPEKSERLRPHIVLNRKANPNMRGIDHEFVGGGKTRPNEHRRRNGNCRKG